jgi:hypothetical protein
MVRGLFLCYVTLLAGKHLCVHVLVGKPESKTRARRPRRRWYDDASVLKIWRSRVTVYGLDSCS